MSFGTGPASVSARISESSLRIGYPRERAVAFGEECRRDKVRRRDQAKDQRDGGGGSGGGAHIRTKGEIKKTHPTHSSASSCRASRGRTGRRSRCRTHPACSYGASSCCTGRSTCTPRARAARPWAPSIATCCGKKYKKPSTITKYIDLCARSRETRSLRFYPTGKGTSQKGGRPDTPTPNSRKGPKMLSTPYAEQECFARPRGSSFLENDDRVSGHDPAPESRRADVLILRMSHSVCDTQRCDIHKILIRYHPPNILLCTIRVVLGFIVFIDSENRKIGSLYEDLMWTWAS